MKQEPSPRVAASDIDYRLLVPFLVHVTLTQTLILIIRITTSYRALELGCRVALANKETLVVAGELMTAKARETGAELLPVDSEHNALHQCLRGERVDEVRRLVLTASGGPFRETPLEALRTVTREQALNHPTWRMATRSRSTRRR